MPVAADYGPRRGDSSPLTADPASRGNRSVSMAVTAIKAPSTRNVHAYAVPAPWPSALDSGVNRLSVSAATAIPRPAANLHRRVEGVGVSQFLGSTSRRQALTSGEADRAQRPADEQDPAIAATGSAGRSAASSPKQPTEARALTSSTRRIPKCRINGVVAGLIARFPANSAATNRPDANGVHPKTSWNCRGNRNATAVITKRMVMAEEMADRGCQQDDRERQAAADHPPIGAGDADIFQRDQCRRDAGPERRGEPRRSSRWTAVAGRPRISLSANRKPAIPIGMLTMKIQRHDPIVAIAPPNTGATTGAARAGQVNTASATMNTRRANRLASTRWPGSGPRR